MSPLARRAALLAAAFALAFRLRFLDTPGGIPDRYWTMLWGSIAFVAIGKSLIFELLGLHRDWWRYFRLPELWPLVRGVAIASALLVGVFVLVDMRDVATSVSIAADALPTESVSTYFEVLDLATRNGLLDPAVHELSVDALVHRWSDDDPRWALLPAAA